MKSLVNSINDSVTETLYGLNYAYPHLEYQVSHKVVLMPRVCTYITLHIYQLIARSMI